MFDNGDRRADVVADLRRRLATVGGEPRAGWPDSGGRAAAGRTGKDAVGVIAVPGPLAEVLPAGGVPRGSVVGVASAAPGGGGATSLLLSLLAASRGMWMAVVGMPDLGLLAAAEMGVDLSRLALVPDPGPDVAQVLSVLSDGMDVIAVAGPAADRSGATRATGRSVAGAPPVGPEVPAARRRVLAGKLRQHGTVLLVLGRWPGADLVLTVCDVRWSGLGQGYGRLRDRDLDVRVAGRRADAAMGAIVTLRLHATRDAVTVGAAGDATAAGLRSAGADTDTAGVRARSVG